MKVKLFSIVAIVSNMAIFGCRQSLEEPVEDVKTNEIAKKPRLQQWNSGWENLVFSHSVVTNKYNETGY